MELISWSLNAIDKIFHREVTTRGSRLSRAERWAMSFTLVVWLLVLAVLSVGDEDVYGFGSTVAEHLHWLWDCSGLPQNYLRQSLQTAHRGSLWKLSVFGAASEHTDGLHLEETQTGLWTLWTYQSLDYIYVPPENCLRLWAWTGTGDWSHSVLKRGTID